MARLWGGDEGEVARLSVVATNSVGLFACYLEVVDLSILAPEIGWQLREGLLHPDLLASSSILHVVFACHHDEGMVVLDQVVVVERVVNKLVRLVSLSNS